MDAIPAGDRFQAVATIGQGAMGEVVLARERTLDREVALKRILPEKREHRALVTHFEREARITAQLDHPGIVPVYEMTRQPDGDLAYTMKVVRGITLGQLIEECREALQAGEALSETRALPARLGHFIKICEAVHYAHQRGFIHRDLKPANVMIGPFSEVYVMDWGISRAIDEPDTLEGAQELVAAESSEIVVSGTQHGLVVGTPRYMSPEQARGEQALLGPKSDQYSLGLILQELVTLQLAVPGEGASTILGFAAEGIRSAVRPLDGQRRIDPELVAIIDKACAREPEARYPSVRDLAADITRHLGGREIQARPDNALQRLGRWFALHRQATLLVMGALLSLFFASSTLFLLWQREQREAVLAREAALTELLTLAGDRSHHIYAHMLVYEGLVHAIATAAEQALTHPPAPGHPAFTEMAFENKLVPGLGWSERYQREISTDWPVFVLPGEDWQTYDPVIARLASLRPTIRAAAIRSAGEKVEGLARQDLDSLIRNEGIPLVAAYVGLENGMHLAWPGKGGYPEGYDPRGRPWYKAALKAMEAEGPHPTWHTPYVDALGLGVVMPCTMPVLDGSGNLLGVAGVELTMGTVMQNLLELDHPGVEAVWLLDLQGRVLAPRADDSPLVPFHLPEIVAEVQAGQSGWKEGLGPEGDTLAVYTTFQDKGLAYVVEGDAGKILSLQ